LRSFAGPSEQLLLHFFTHALILSGIFQVVNEAHAARAGQAATLTVFRGSVSAVSMIGILLSYSIFQNHSGKNESMGGFKN
jgi:hypothetical protein